MSLGQNYLDFELRAWIGAFAHRRLAHSGLNQEIDRRFLSEGVEIPFPRRDQNVRSAEESTDSALTTPGDHHPGVVVLSRKERDEEEDK